MKKLLVLLLCMLAVFAVVSCKNDPKPDPKPETFTVSFDSQGGSAVAAATVEKDAKVEKPADPIKLGADFVGWYTEAACENKYDFEDAVTESFTLYAKWIPGPEPEVTTYKLTSTLADTRFQFKWDTVEDSAGKVFTLKYKSDKNLGTFTIRNGAGAKYKDGASLSDYTVVGEDGWTTFSYTMPEGNTGIGLALFESVEAAIGDVMYIKDIYIGDKALELTQANSWYGNECKIEKLSYYRLKATKGTDGSDSHKYDQDKFTLYWNPNVEVKVGDVLTVTFKAVRKDEMTKDRPFTYSIRDKAKWFSEKAYGKDEYPLFWSTFSEPDCEGWITATYVFPAEGTQETITYPATFRVDFRDTKIASPAEGRIADLLYVTNMTLTSGETVTPLVIDETRSSTAYSCPIIEKF